MGRRAGDTGLATARSVTLRDFPAGQLVVAKSDLFSLEGSLSGEKELSSRVVLRPWLLAAWSAARRTELCAVTCLCYKKMKCMCRSHLSLLHRDRHFEPEA